MPRQSLHRIETPRDLSGSWPRIARALKSDLGAASRLAADPRGTLRGLGFDVGAEAASLLLTALQLSV